MLKTIFVAALGLSCLASVVMGMWAFDHANFEGGVRSMLIAIFNLGVFAMWTREE